jgi:hypothetical protein
MLRKRQNAVLAILGLVVLVSIFAGCAAKIPLWGGPDTGYILSYRIAPQTTLRYELFTKSVQTMEMMGQSMENTSDNLFQITYNGRGTNPEKNLLLTIVIDSATMSFKGMGQERTTDLSSVEGKPFGLIVSPLGKEIGTEGADSIMVDFGAMAGGKQSIKTWFRGQFPQLPDHPVKIGESWISEDVETRPATGMEMKVTTQTTNKLEGIETVGGEECFKVTFTAKGTMEGKGEQMGAQISMEAELEGKGTWYFAYKKGIYTDSKYEMFFEGTVAVTGPANMTIPINGTVTTTSKKIM